MNILEYMIYDVYRNKFFSVTFSEILEQFKEGFTYLFAAIFNSIFLILFPIGLLIRAIYRTRSARKEVENSPFER